MVWISDTLWCDGCGVEITWTPQVNGHQHYCCEECAKGRACECAAWVEQEDERRQAAAESVASGSYQ